MITSIQTHHRYGDKRCVPCGMTKERALSDHGCSYADCPWRHPPRNDAEMYLHFHLFAVREPS